MSQTKQFLVKSVWPLQWCRFYMDCSVTSQKIQKFEKKIILRCTLFLEKETGKLLLSVFPFSQM